MKNIFSLILLTVALCISQTAFAERTVLYFHFEGCPYCPPVKSEILNSPDSKSYKLLAIDITKYLDWKREFRANRVPKVVIADIENNNYKIHYEWQPGDKNSISTILKQFRIDKSAK
jgi:hypothetical protein